MFSPRVCKHRPYRGVSVDVNVSLSKSMATGAVLAKRALFVVLENFRRHLSRTVRRTKIAGYPSLSISLKLYKPQDAPGRTPTELDVSYVVDAANALRWPRGGLGGIASTGRLAEPTPPFWRHAQGRASLARPVGHLRGFRRTCGSASRSQWHLAPGFGPAVAELSAACPWVSAWPPPS